MRVSYEPCSVLCTEAEYRVPVPMLMMLMSTTMHRGREKGEGKTDDGRAAGRATRKTKQKETSDRCVHTRSAEATNYYMRREREVRGGRVNKIDTMRTGTAVSGRHANMAMSRRRRWMDGWMDECGKTRGYNRGLRSDAPGRAHDSLLALSVIERPRARLHRRNRDHSIRNRCCGRHDPK